jgi:hypothetical protein
MKRDMLPDQAQPITRETDRNNSKLRQHVHQTTGKLATKNKAAQPRH